MSPEAAQIVVVAITGVGAIVWFLALKFVMSSARVSSSMTDASFGDSGHAGMLTGRAECAGDSQALSNKAAELLAKEMLGPVRIVDKTNDRVAFERLESGMGRQPPGRWFRRGELRFERLGQNQTQIEWSVEPSNFRWLLSAAVFALFLGLVALIVGCWAVLTFVASSENSTVRWQSLQMLQVGHFLWPPFLFAGLYRKGIGTLQAQFQGLASNLPYLGNPQERPR